MSAKTFPNTGKNISENIVKQNLEQNMKSLLYNHYYTEEIIKLRNIIKLLTVRCGL